MVKIFLPDLQLEINWNIGALFFPPPPYIYNCTLDALSPRPSEVVNFTLLSYEVQSRGVRIVASWEPPAEVNGILRSYTMCVTPTPLQGHEEGHSNCRENIQVSTQYGRGSSEMSSCFVINLMMASSQI